MEKLVNIVKIYKFAVVMAMIMAAGMTSCSNDANDLDDAVATSQSADTKNSPDVKTLHVSLSGVVSDFDNFGMLEPSFTPQQMKEAGFDYGDFIDVQIGKNITIKNVPYVTGFNEVGVFEFCLCDYNAKGTTFGFGQLHGNFKERIGGVPGDSITVTLAQKQGYMDTWEMMKSVYTSPRSDYNDKTDEEYANFREVKTTGMDAGVLYRSSNPLNPKDNAERYLYVDNLARHYGVNTEIDLADTPAKIQDFMAYEGYNSTYCPQLFKEGRTIALGLTADTYGETFMKTLGEGLKFMLNNKPPYLLHCNEGKDRCGFVSMLLEALAGATYDEVAADYMQTLINFYRIEKGSESYQIRQRISIDRLVWLLENVDKVDDFSSVDWSNKDPRTVKLQTAAEDYVQKCGLTKDECSKLQSILRGEIK